ncbi:FAD-binding protein [Brachybacterium sp. NBEC-018]|uniref:FAD-binding protein n=1 Tax=Brachybacterium sp. NBEC-018 TaxID=2996004 RepID=UPI002174E485|nr:FAD-binding protein [Brachybacterium sp. NBEC-018]UVY84063.1 FAD-binding protein [Brachybacterium sp. NBEC-018]
MTRTPALPVEQAGATWSGCHTFAARELLRPRSIEQLQEAVAASTRIRALGTRHSFNDVADTDGSLVTVQGLPERIEIDEQGGTVTVSGGTIYARLAERLGATGWALANMGSLPHISVAGAVSTGTHGSGVQHRNLSDAVRAIEAVTADGTLRRWTREEDPDFAGRALSLGALGITTALTLDLVPSFEVRQDVWFELPWAALLEHLEEIMGAAYSVSVMPDWSSRERAGKVWLKSRTDAWDDALDPARFGARWARTPHGERAEGQLPHQTDQGGAPGPWWQRLPHFRPDANPSRGDEIQTEYFVDRRDGAAALAALREHAERFAPLVLVSELRTVAADDLWLSPAHGRDSLGIHLTWANDPAAVLEVLPLIEAALAPFAPRTHWGKWSTLPGEAVREQYPQLPAFRALAEDADPTGKLRNDYLERMLGLGRG